MQSWDSIWTNKTKTLTNKKTSPLNMSGLICKFKLPTPCQCGLAAGVYNSPQILVFCRRIWTRQREQTNLRHHVQDHRDHAAAHRSGQQLVWQHRYIQGSLALNLLCMALLLCFTHQLTQFKCKLLCATLSAREFERKCYTGLMDNVLRFV